MFETLIALLTFVSVEAVPVNHVTPTNALEAVFIEIPEPQKLAVIEATTTPVEPLVKIALNAPKRPLDESSNVFCSCIRFLRLVKGIPIKGYAFARDIPHNISFLQSRRGDLVLLDFEPYGHVAEILEKRPDGILVDQSNKVKCTRTQELLAYDNPFIKGFHRPLLVTLTSKPF